MFEELHGAASAKDFADDLKEVARTYYGTPIRAFLRQLVCESQDDLRAAWQVFQKDFLNTCQAEFLNRQPMQPQIGRACDRFALVAFAGEMATEAGITGWNEGDTKAAALRMFGDWLKARGTGSTDEEAALRQVRLFLESHSDSRFRRLGGGDERTIINQAGYIERNDNGEIKIWYILPEVFRAEVCKGFDSTRVAKLLQARDCLRTTHDLRCEKRVPNGRDKFYAITQKIIGE